MKTRLSVAALACVVALTVLMPALAWADDGQSKAATSIEASGYAQREAASQGMGLEGFVGGQEEAADAGLMIALVVVGIVVLVIIIVVIACA